MIKFKKIEATRQDGITSNAFLLSQLSKGVQIPEWGSSDKHKIIKLKTKGIKKQEVLISISIKVLSRHSNVRVI